jgi:hypothetical protein
MISIFKPIVNHPHTSALAPSLQCIILLSIINLSLYDSSLLITYYRSEHNNQVNTTCNPPAFLQCRPVWGGEDRYQETGDREQRKTEETNKVGRKRDTAAAFGGLLNALVLQINYILS